VYGSILNVWELALMQCQITTSVTSVSQGELV